jgi:ribose/xylose/arabinose/galactoside ABC-type transport system permease subunit
MSGYRQIESVMTSNWPQYLVLWLLRRVESYQYSPIAAVMDLAILAFLVDCLGYLLPGLRRQLRVPRILNAHERGLVAGVASVLLIVYFLDRDRAFFTSYNLDTMLHRVALFGVLALGAAVVIIAGGIDLSTGAVVALSSVVCGKLLTEWLHNSANSGAPSNGVVVSAIGLTLLMGLCIGLLHALFINQLRLPPFIATLATMAGLRSVATLLCQNKTINLPFDAFRRLGRDASVSQWVFVCVGTAISVVMGCTVLGRHLFALGGNEPAARLSGLRTRWLKAVAYGLSGTLAALGGILFAGYSGQADSRSGNAYELIAITAAVVGGCSLSGGAGSIRGTFLGLLLTQIVLKGTGIVTKGVDSTQIEGLVLGTVVLVAVAFNQRFQGSRN